MMIKQLIMTLLVSSVSIQAIAEGLSAEYSNIPGVDCVINPYKVADIASPVAGVIETLYVERSQSVNAGQVIVQLDADIERASVELARFRAAIQSEIKLGQVNMTFDQKRNKRIRSLRENQAVSMEAIDEAEREADLSKWKLQQARELADVRQLELKRAEEQLRQKSITAPFDGFVLDTFKHRGEYVEDQSILRLAQLNPLVIEAIMPMENFGKIKVGMEAEILPESLSGEKLVGTVSIVDRIGDTASNTFGVRLVMPNPENRIPAGIKCVAKFFQQSDENIAEADHKKGMMVEKNMVEVMLDINKSASTHFVNSADETYSELVDIVDNPIVVETVGSYMESTADDNYVEVEVISNEVENNKKTVLTEKQPDNTEILTEYEETWQEGVFLQDDEKVSSYLVVTEQEESRPLTRALISRLRDSGVHDLQQVNHGPYKGHILLGLYKHRSRAEQRQDTLAELGFSSFIRDRY